MRNLRNLFEQIYQYFNHHYWLVFIIVSSLLIILNLTQIDTPFLHDANRYWTLADRFTKDGEFSLINYDYPVRGYLFPLIIFFIRRIAVIIGVQEVHFFLITMSLVYSAFLTVLVPSFVKLLFIKRIKSVQILIFSILAIYFHGSLFFYPLSDLLATIFLLSGVYLVLKYSASLLHELLAGICLACASLVRPSYLIVLPFFVVWALFYYSHEKKLQFRHSMIRLLIIFVGIILIFIPQTSINHKHFGSLSPLIQTQYGYKDGLLMQQLNWGIEIQKYETNVGLEYPSAQVFFFDGHGRFLLARWKQSNELSASYTLTLRNYLRLVLTYPLDMLVIYARHLFNGLDVVYRSVYINNVYKTSYLIRLLNYSIWFLVTFYLAKRVKFQYSQIDKWLLVFIIILPSLVSIPMAIEIRFMLPVFLLAYALVSFWIIPEFIALSSSMKKEIAIGYMPYFVLFIVVCFMLSANTYVGLQHGLIR